MTLTLALQIATIVLVLLVPFIAYRKMPGLAAATGIVLFTASYFISNFWQVAYIYLEPPQAYGLALRLYTFSLLLLVAIYAAIIFLWMTRTKPVDIDLQARLIWLVLLIAEGVAIAEYVECKLFVDPFGSGDLMLSQVWGIEVSRFACGRHLGPVAPYIAPAVCSLYLIWINWRASGVKR